MAVTMLKVMKQRSQFPSCLNFAFQGRTQGISQDQWRGCVVGLFPLCSNLPCVQVLHFKPYWKILRR